MNPVRILTAAQVYLSRANAPIEEADAYNRLSVEPQAIQLSAEPSSLRHGLPKSGESVLIQAASREAFYHIRAKVVESAIEEAEARLQLRIQGKPERIQRRSNFRVRLRLPAKLVEVNGGPSEIIRTETADLSAGGMRVPYPRPAIPGQLVYATVSLGDGKPALMCQAKVVRVVEDGTGPRHIAIEFVGLEETEQDRLVSHLTDRLRWSIRPVVEVGEEES